MDPERPVFGQKQPDKDYQRRPGSYGFVRDKGGSLLVIKTPNGLHLPGGGREPGETPEENLRRELFEECGLQITQSTYITSASQCLHVVGEGYFKKECDYFLVKATGVARNKEVGHSVCWMVLDQALRQLSHESHRYGLRLAISMGGFHECKPT